MELEEHVGLAMADPARMERIATENFMVKSGLRVYLGLVGKWQLDVIVTC